MGYMIHDKKEHYLSIDWTSTSSPFSLLLVGSRESGSEIKVNDTLKGKVGLPKTLIEIEKHLDLSNSLKWGENLKQLCLQIPSMFSS